ncbi:uncharacterized protein [Branchiostoma lanceolatum]|uniref:uncharacterized protein n=1 Tax=Branchiostoma lanceolatum TaxID=7740 RepID=UPI003454C504
MKLSRSTFLSGLVSLLPVLVAGHSWVACTDYTEMNGADWDAGKCRAFPRSAHELVPKNVPFGTDKGYNFHGKEDQPCRTTRNDAGAYTAEHPMAVYYPGQKVVFTHPTKNHVADPGCTNNNIPDNGNQIFVGPKDADADPKFSEFDLLEDLGVSPTGNQPESVMTSYPKPGYQNAPKFCENTDKALATGNFTLPTDMQPGRYTFLWAWSFNGPEDTYTSCWEADVVASQTERDSRLQQRGQVSGDACDFNTNCNGGNSGGGNGESGGGSSGESGTGEESGNSGEETEGCENCLEFVYKTLKTNVAIGEISISEDFPPPRADPDHPGQVDVKFPFPVNNAVFKIGRSTIVPSTQTTDGVFVLSEEDLAPLAGSTLTVTVRFNRGAGPDCFSQAGRVRIEHVGYVAQTTLDIFYEQEWNGGGMGRIVLPESRRTLPGDWWVEVLFPCPDLTFQVWYGNDQSTGEQKSAGQYVIRQPEWETQNTDHIGFTVQNSACAELDEVVAHLVTAPK